VAQTEETPVTQKGNASNGRHHLSLEKRRMSLALYVFCYIVFLNGYKTIFALLTNLPARPWHYFPAVPLIVLGV